MLQPYPLFKSWCEDISAEDPNRLSLDEMIPEMIGFLKHLPELKSGPQLQEHLLRTMLAFYESVPEDTFSETEVEKFTHC